jgi:hypothetical protein
MAFIGICKSLACCTYSHALQEAIPATKATKVASQLKKMVVAFVAKP